MDDKSLEALRKNIPERPELPRHQTAKQAVPQICHQTLRAVWQMSSNRPVESASRSQSQLCGVTPEQHSQLPSDFLPRSRARRASGLHCIRVRRGLAVLHRFESERFATDPNGRQGSTTKRSVTVRCHPLLRPECAQFAAWGNSPASFRVIASRRESDSFEPLADAKNKCTTSQVQCPGRQT